MTASGAAHSTTNDRYRRTIAAPLPSPVSVIYLPLAAGNLGTYQTLDAMRAAVLGRIPPDYSGYTDPWIRQIATDILARSSTAAFTAASTRMANPHDRARIRAIFEWVTANITYAPHPINQQTLQDARRTIELGHGDCVSLSVLIATLLGAIGYRSRFIAQWVDGLSASHVYVEVWLPRERAWLALDAVAKDQPMGWRQPLLDGGFDLAWEIFNG